jgi:hypothetical protein
MLGFEEDEERDHRRHVAKSDRKRTREKTDLLLEEMAPKPSGRELQLENKRLKSEYTRRERSPNMEFGERDLFGDDGDSFRTA